MVKLRNPDTGQIIALSALAGIAGYAIYQMFKKKDKFENLVALYDGQVPGSSVPKSPGDSVTVDFTFNHLGPGGEFDIGIGLAPASAVTGSYGPVQQWVYQTLVVPEDKTLSTRTVIMTGIIPLATPAGKKDSLKWIQTKGGGRLTNGEGFLVSGWDRDCYNITGRVGEAEFQTLLGTYS